MDVQAISFTGKTPKMPQNVKCSKEYQEAMSKLLGQSDKDFLHSVNKQTTLKFHNPQKNL